MMMMKCQFHWWRKPEYLDETTDLRQVTDETFLDTAHAQSQNRTLEEWSTQRAPYLVTQTCGMNNVQVVKHSPRAPSL